MSATFNKAIDTITDALVEKAKLIQAQLDSANKLLEEPCALEPSPATSLNESATKTVAFLGQVLTKTRHVLLLAEDLRNVEALVSKSLKGLNSAEFPELSTIATQAFKQKVELLLKPILKQISAIRKNTAQLFDSSLEVEKKGTFFQFHTISSHLESLLNHRDGVNLSPDEISDLIRLSLELTDRKSALETYRDNYQSCVGREPEPDTDRIISVATQYIQHLQKIQGTGHVDKAEVSKLVMKTFQIGPAPRQRTNPNPWMAVGPVGGGAGVATTPSL